MLNSVRANAQNAVDMVFFWGSGCPHCKKAIPFLDELENKYPNLTIHRLETWHNKKNLESLEKVSQAYNAPITAVPAFIIGDYAPLVGYSEYMQKEIIQKIESCIEIGCISPLTKAKLNTVFIQTSKEEPEEYTYVPSPSIEKDTPDQETLVDVPLLGNVDLSNAPLLLTTALIAFVDGFNPCSTWLIMFLLGMVIHTRSRKKVLIVSLTFLLITAAAYGAFMLGVLNVFMYVGYLKWIQVVVAIMALLFAAVNIKDYFWFKKGLSFTISDKHKPGIFKDMRAIIKPEKSTFAMIGATAVMALGVVLVELPCTAGFPVIWANLLAKHDISGLYFVLLLSVYILIYLLDELALIIAAVMTLKVTKFEEKHGRMLKLIGGMVMASLAGFMLLAPDTLNTLKGTLLVFVIAAVSSATIIIVHQKILPKLRNKNI
jgi:thiol-disulfide isomerase/thioredoxin